MCFCVLLRFPLGEHEYQENTSSRVDSCKSLGRQSGHGATMKTESALFVHDADIASHTDSKRNGVLSVQKALQGLRSLAIQESASPSIRTFSTSSINCCLYDAFSFCIDSFNAANGSSSPATALMKVCTLRSRSLNALLCSVETFRACCLH